MTIRLDLHKELCDLEWELTSLRAERERLDSEVARLQQGKDYYSGLFEAAPFGYVILDELSHIKGANQELALLLEHELAVRMGGTFSSYVTKDCLAGFLAHLRQLKSQGKRARLELTLKTCKGRTFPAELVSVPLGAGEGFEIRTAVLDITDRLQMRENLALTQRNFHALVEGIDAMIWEADAQTFEVSFVSRSVERMLGYTVERWYAMGSWPSFVHVEDRDRVLNKLSKVLATGQDAVLEYRMVAHDRRVIWVRDVVTVRQISGRQRLCGVAVDITDRKVAEEKLVEANDRLESRVANRTAELREKVSEMEAFSYSLSHDMRAPLRAMQGYAQILAETLGDTLPPDGREYLRRITTSAERLDALIRDVLTYSKIVRSPVELRPVNLERLTDAVIGDYPAFQPDRAELVVEKPLLDVLANEAFLTQCLSNLLSNAVKFVAAGQKPHVRVRTQRVGNHVQLWIEDNGIGIASEDQSRIFGIFQRVHGECSYEGTGIGLAIVQKAAERMGGCVGVQSAPGQGSKFWLQLAAA